MAGSFSDSDSEIEVVGTITEEEGNAKMKQMKKLHYAIRSNDIEYLSDNLGSLSAFVNSPFDFGDRTSPIYLAVNVEHFEVLKMLIAAGFGVDVGTKSPLYHASLRGRAEVVKMLLGAGADPDKARTDTGSTPLYGASSYGHAEVVKMLLGAGVDPNKARTDTGDTPLNGASSYGFAEVVKILLGARADPNKATTDNGTTPVFMASQEGFAEVVKILLDAGADPNKATTDDGQTPVYTASRSGYAEVVKMLLGAGANPNKTLTTVDGQTPLYGASRSGHTEVVKILLGAGADPNKATADNNITPLSWACHRADANMVEMLLDANADPNIAMTDDGMTPLMWSVLQALDDAALAVVQLLAMAGADLAQDDSSNETAAMKAQHQNLPKTVAWLNSVANLNQVQIIVALGREDVLRKILRRGEIDLFSPRAQGTPSITELAAAVRPSMKRLVTEAKLVWAPVRHGLFHPAHRSTVYCILLVARRAPNRLGLGREWIRMIPTEIWFIIIEWLGRVGWPNEGRQALLQFPSPGSVNVRASTDFSDPNNLGRIGVANVLPGEYLFSPDVAAEFEDFMVYAKDQRRRIDTTLKNAKTLRRAMDDIIKAAKEIKSGIQSGDEEKRKLRYKCEETIKRLQTVNGFTKKMQGVFLEEHRVVEDLMGV
ncbi:MAG: ankyrin repeat domain-containing protein [Limisphaerales bacterium]